MQPSITDPESSLTLYGVFEEFPRNREAHLAAWIVDPALRDSQAATTGAVLFVQSLERPLALGGCKRLQIDARDLGRVRGVREQHLTCVLDALDARAGREPGEHAYFMLGARAAQQPEVPLQNAALRIDHECGGHGGDAAEFRLERARRHHH